jgi:all-trans-retinol 13,14-reductase
MTTTTPSITPDVIVIGSGIGGLTLASLLAQLQHKRVLVLERHFQPGGFTHQFSRGKYHWDVGLHYVGQMEKTSLMRQMFDLVTRSQVEWARLSEPFERFSYPGFEFNVHGDPQRYVADLIGRFPDERAAIRTYFNDVSRAARALTFTALQTNTQGWLRLLTTAGRLWTGRHLALTTKDYLQLRFRNPMLRTLLASQWGDYGLPPAASAFPVHATIAHHYRNGAYYPVGGAGRIAESVRRIVEDAGGQVLARREVTEIIIEDGRATGVRVRITGTREPRDAVDYYAPIIVSDAGPAATYLRLVPQSHPLTFREELCRFVQQHSPSTHVCLYVGFSADPRSLGIGGGNIWIYQDTDHDACFARRSKALEQGAPEQAYVSFPSLRDPQATLAHTAEIITFADYDQFARWRDQPWLHRDEDYAQFKERIAEGLLRLVESRLPGFSSLVAQWELSTPVTNEHFTGHDRGGIYGLTGFAERFNSKSCEWTSVRTPIPGLYLTGVDAMRVAGIVPGMISGIVTLSALPGGLSLASAFKEGRRRAHATNTPVKAN